MKTQSNLIEVRPWGTYEVLTELEGHKVKRIIVLPGKRLSLQRHKQRAEHWYVVQGIGMVTVGEKSFTISPGESVDVPVGVVHRVENVGDENFVFIEIQTGSYLGEDDIERLEDDFGRV